MKKGRSLTPVVGLVFLLIIWTVVKYFNVVDDLYLPAINTTFKEIVIFFTNGGVNDLISTLIRVFISFIISSIIGIFFGLILGVYRSAFSYFELIIDFFRSVPSIAFFPLFLLILGIGDSSKIGLAAFVSFWIVLINTTSGVWNSSKMRIKVAKVFRFSEVEIFKRVVFFESLPQIFIGLKTSLSLTLVMIIITEMFFGTRYGIGTQIFNSYSSYDTAKLYAMIIIVGGIGYLLNKLFTILEKRIIHWL